MDEKEIHARLIEYIERLKIIAATGLDGAKPVDPARAMREMEEIVKWVDKREIGLKELKSIKGDAVAAIARGDCGEVSDGQFREAVRGVQARLRAWDMRHMALLGEIEERMCEWDSPGSPV